MGDGHARGNGDAGHGGPMPMLFAHYGEEGIRGSERVLLDLLRHLNRDQVQPTVWCNSETMATATRNLGIETYTSRMPLLLGWDAPRLDLRQYQRLRAEANALLERRAIRLVHANSGAPNQWLVPAARERGIALVAHLHAHYVLRDRCTLLLHRAPVIVGCTRAVVEPFAADGVPSARLRVIPNGVDVERLAKGDAVRLRAELNIPATETVVTCVGALIPLKGFDIAIRAASILRMRQACPVFLIVGRGPEEGPLRALAADLGVADRVLFLGSREDAGAILRDASDVVLVPSRMEAFGLTVAEAAMFGVPAVASDVPGLNETIIDGVTGHLVKEGSPEAFADALQRLTVDAPARRAAGSRARAHALQHFSVQSMANAFSKLYGELGANTDALTRNRAGYWRPWGRLSAQWIGKRLRGR